MSFIHESVNEVKGTKSAKSVKRVRFSDDVERVDFAESDDSGSVSLENFNKKSSELFTSHSKHDSSNTVSTLNGNGPDYNSIRDGNNNSDLLSSLQYVTPSYQTSTQISDSSEDECIDEQTESYSSDNELKDDNNHETQELIELINETMSMVISSVESDESNKLLSKAKECYEISLPETNSKSIPFEKVCSATTAGLTYFPSNISQKQDNIFVGELENNQDSLQCIKESSDALCLSRKRSLEGNFIDKQTSKLNDCLSKNNSEFNSADELKSVVYTAWNTVKNESSVKNQLKSTSVIKEINDASEKSNSNKVYEMWKKSKRKMKKTNYLASDHKLILKSSRSKSKKDLEESKMAYLAWKKRADKMWKEIMAEKRRKQEKEKFDSLMNKRIRKSEAESAFSAWNAHKSVTIKLEKKKNQWFLEKEREKVQMKVKRSEEAAKMYHEWLRNKVYSVNTCVYKTIDHRPPWTPPGKGT